MSAGKGGKHGLPQVNLLPPEVRAARGLKVVRRWLLLGLVVVVGLLGGVYALSVLDRSSAETERAEAQAETARLQAEQEKYAEVPRVLAALNDANRARELGMSTEVLWGGYFDAITAVLPQDVSIETVVMTGATPVMLAAAPESPLFRPSVGQLTITGRTIAMPDTAAWADALDSIPGFADAWVSAQIRSEEDESIFYAVTASVRILDSAYSGRFAEIVEES